MIWTVRDQEIFNLDMTTLPKFYGHIGKIQIAMPVKMAVLKTFQNARLCSNNNDAIASNSWASSMETCWHILQGPFCLVVRMTCIVYLCIHQSIAALWTNSLGSSDAIWRWRSWSTLVQVMSCCLTTPSHYLNQCWLIISKVLWHSSMGIILRSEDTNQ